MTRNQLLYKICPTDPTFDCRTGNKSCNCNDCNRVLEEWLNEYDKQIRAKAINDYYNKLSEKINTDTNLKDTIREIHDNVAQEMYCKGIDDVVIKIKECVGMDWEWDFYFIGQIAEKLKAGVKNEN